MAKPVPDRTESASARPIVAPSRAAPNASVSTRSSPPITTMMGAPSARNTRVLAIWACNTPKAAAASAAVRVDSSKCRTSASIPAASRASTTRATLPDVLAVGATPAFVEVSLLIIE